MRMAFRTIVIKNRCKLEYSLNYLVYRGESEKRILLSEISTLIIQNQGVAMTAALLSKLMENKTTVIFCDGKSNPQGQLIPYYGCHNPYSRISEQLTWDQSLKDKLWAIIIRQKIDGQRKNLLYLKKDESASKLQDYLEGVQTGDATNREGHSAKAYFNSCFGKDFNRDLEIPTNAYLNYGYSIILSAINREVKSFGYLTELGLHHIGETNPFNLSCDLMEPLRPYVDFLVLSNQVNEENFKKRLIEMLDDMVIYCDDSMHLENAIHLYIQSIFTALSSKDLSKVHFVSYELH